MDNSTILVIDDTKSNIDMIMGLLGDQYDILVSLDGSSAIRIAKEEKIDLILLDIMMPNISGYDICKKLKNNNITKDIPIIFITAKTDKKSIEKAYEAGDDDYITKPFKPKELQVKIKAQLD